MKAYILKISFENIAPLIWRRFIMPADATFNRLHETIQNVTNFQSDLEPYHSFSIEVEDYFITNNDAIQGEFAGKTVRRPSHIKMDAYLEKHGELLYTYDFGDDWRIRVVLEETVDDYYFGYPTLLDGEGTAPPEDVGGPPGYEEFLKVYEDPTHPDYLSMFAWAEHQGYVPLDIDQLNDRLKFVKYKKTEWQHIDHEKYTILSDKYRGSEMVNIDRLPNKDLIIQYAGACVNLYGVIRFSKFLEIYNAQNETSLSSGQLRALLKAPYYKKILEGKFVHVHGNILLHETFDDTGKSFGILQETIGKSFYIPKKEELLRYTDELYYEKTNHQKELANMLAKDFFGGSKLMVQEEIDELVLNLQASGGGQWAIQEFFGRFEWEDMVQMNDYMQVVTMISNTTRLWENRGHTPEDLFEMEKHHLKSLPMTPFNVISGGKVGRNEPCPCGSGKKYKKCCGK